MGKGDDVEQRIGKGGKVKYQLKGTSGERSEDGTEANLGGLASGVRKAYGRFRGEGNSRPGDT